MPMLERLKNLRKKYMREIIKEGRGNDVGMN